MTTGEKVKMARKELGLSQEKLAKEIGISRHALAEIENGETKDMLSSTALRLSDALALDLSYLLRP